jgi:hypothetical protein
MDEKHVAAIFLRLLEIFVDSRVEILKYLDLVVG